MLLADWLNYVSGKLYSQITSRLHHTSWDVLLLGRWHPILFNFVGGVSVAYRVFRDHHCIWGSYTGRRKFLREPSAIEVMTVLSLSVSLLVSMHVLSILKLLRSLFISSLSGFVCPFKAYLSSCLLTTFSADLSGEWCCSANPQYSYSTCHILTYDPTYQFRCKQLLHDLYMLRGNICICHTVCQKLQQNSVRIACMNYTLLWWYDFFDRSKQKFTTVKQKE